MTATQTITVAVCVGQLALALVGIARASRSPLAVPFALLCLNMFGWTGATLAFELTQDSTWQWVDHTLTPLTAPLALQFVLVFVGRRRALRATMAVAWMACGAFSVVSVLDFASPAVHAFIGSHAWSRSLVEPGRERLFLSLEIPTMAFAIVALFRHLRESLDATERARTRLLLGAFAIGTVTASSMELTDGMQLLANIAARIPDLPVIVLTAHGTVKLAVEAMRAGAADFLLKPFDRDQIV
jgi:CheY-like chemotaxis protein